MEDVKDRRLAELCASIGDTRDQMNALRADEQGDMQAALDRMKALGIMSFRSNGVEMARVPGAEKLRVRTSKDKATAEVDEVDQVDEGPAAGEFGEERLEALEGEG